MSELIESSDSSVETEQSEKLAPRYATIEAELRQRLDRGLIRVGESFPTEKELCQDFHVSRHTVRRALEALEREGLISRHPGRGTIVTRPPLVTQPLTGFYSFVGSMSEQGREPRSITLEQERIPASELSASRLRITHGEPLIRLVRKRLADDMPLALEIVEIPECVCPALVTIDLGDRSLYEVIESLSDVTITGAYETIRPIVLSEDDARLLDVPPRSAAFNVERITSAHEHIIEWRQSLIRGDRYLYSVDLPRRSTAVEPSVSPTVFPSESTRSGPNLSR